MQDIFEAIYEQETEDIPLNEGLMDELALKLGFGLPAEPLTVKPFIKIDDWMATDFGFGNYPPRRVRRPVLPRILSNIAVSNEMSLPAFYRVKSMSFKRSHNIGLSAGGAKDVVNFRRNIDLGYLPMPTDITYEGLFYDYFFDTGKIEECRELFRPSYSTAVSQDPISGNLDRYLSVGLNSGITEKDFKRPDLDVVVVLDVSGSMDSGFDEYHYDSTASTEGGVEKEKAKSKLDAAKEAVSALFEHLKGDDRLGIVLFNDKAWLAKPLRSVAETDIEAIKGHISDISAEGSTDMDAGMRTAAKQFGNHDTRGTGRENRIIFITDAMPNMGDTSRGGLLKQVRCNAEKGIYTTFIGVGVDFQSELVEALTKTEGANYYTVRSPKEFRERMDEGFDYMVTPLVFDLKLDLVATGYEIEKVYGSPDADQTTGELMNIRTLFPSQNSGTETRGGLVLLKLKKFSGNQDIKLHLTYRDRGGMKHEQESTVIFDESVEERYDNSGIRKGIWLSRYADLLKNWTIDQRKMSHKQNWAPAVNEAVGIVEPKLPRGFLGRWERQSLPLSVSYAYGSLFMIFRTLFAQETKTLCDRTLQQELDVIDKLIEKASKPYVKEAGKK